MEKKLRIAFIGTGGMGRGHVNAFSQDPRVEIVALCDLVPEKCRRIMSELNMNVPVYTDFREMIEKETLDAVDVVTSNDYHSIAAVYALEKGLHVFCEKPDAINAAEGQGGGNLCGTVRLDPAAGRAWTGRVVHRKSPVRRRPADRSGRAYDRSGHMADGQSRACVRFRLHLSEV